MTEDGKGGDPVYISHLIVDTLLKGIKGELVQRETTTETDRGTTTTTVYEARLGYLTLLFKVIQDGKAVKGGGNRFEIILPNARFMRDPLLPEGAPPIPM